MARQGRPATHIIHEWPDDAVKVIGKKQLEANKWHYVTVTYNGKGTAKGVRIYVDGARQDVEVAADKLRNSIRTSVPFGSSGWKLPIRYTKTKHGGKCKVGCHVPREYDRRVK